MLTLKPFILSKNKAMISSVATQIKELQNQLIHHPLYKEIRTPADLRLFMEHHVFAVWDFMSLLKGLQIQLTGTTLPWVPIGSPETRYLINEIVVAEETDLNLYGKRQSHFEMYLGAMQKAGAQTKTIDRFIEYIVGGMDYQKALQHAGAPDAVCQFVQFTFSVLETQQPHKIAAAFTFGREDLIPQMFTAIIDAIQNQFPEEDLAEFSYYFHRHIELDDDTHCPLALSMIEQLCGDDLQKWADVLAVSQAALKHRILLWEGILCHIKNPVLA